MPKVYYVKANSYKDALSKVKKMRKCDEDENSQELAYARDDLEKALKYLKKCLKDTSKVDAPIKKTLSCVNVAVDYVEKALEMIEDDKSYQKTYKEDGIVKKGSGWVNEGKEGTHGTFTTQKGARQQQKAMFANGYKKR